MCMILFIMYIPEQYAIAERPITIIWMTHYIRNVLLLLLLSNFLLGGAS